MSNNLPSLVENLEILGLDKYCLNRASSVIGSDLVGRLFALSEESEKKNQKIHYLQEINMDLYKTNAVLHKENIRLKEKVQELTLNREKDLDLSIENALLFRENARLKEETEAKINLLQDPLYMRIAAAIPNALASTVNPVASLTNFCGHHLYLSISFVPVHNVEEEMHGVQLFINDEFVCEASDRKIKVAKGKSALAAIWRFNQDKEFADRLIKIAFDKWSNYDQKIKDET